MNQPTLDSLLSGWLEADAPRVPPPGFVERVLVTTGRMRPLPTWRAMTAVPVMRSHSAVLVGSPGLRLVRLAAGLLLLLAALTGAAVVGAQLMQDVALHRAQLIVFVSTEQAFGDSPPEWRAPATPNWWECGDDPDCFGAAGVSGPAPGWVYAMSPDGRDAPRVIGELSLPRGAPLSMLAEISHDGRYVLIGPVDAQNVYRVFRLEGGTSILDLGCSYAHSWSPTSALFAYTIENGCGGDPSESGLFIYDADANVTRKILDATPDPDPASPVGGGHLGWSPDGHSVFVTRDHNCSATPYIACYMSVDLIEVDTDGSPPETRKIASATNRAGLLAPDATRILYESGNGLEVSNLDGSNPRRLAEGTCLQSPTWSPDGDWVPYVDCAAIWPADADLVAGDAPIDAPIVVLPAAGGDPRIVGTALYDLRSELPLPPRFTPDSGSVYWSDANGTWAVDVDGTNFRRLPVPAGVAIDWQFDGP